MQETHYAAALNPALESSHSPLPSLEPQKTTIATVNAVDSYDINGSAKDESHGESTLQDIFGDMTADSTTTPASTVSKRAQNKLKRKERELATREEYKAKLKAKRVAKKEAKRELRQQQPFETLPADEQARIEERRRRADPSLKDPSSMGVVVDLSFDELMHEKEINSTALQISRCYTANRNGMRPCQLVVSSFEGRVKTRMVKNQKMTESEYYSI